MCLCACVCMCVYRDVQNMSASTKVTRMHKNKQKSSYKRRSHTNYKVVQANTQKPLHNPIKYVCALFPDAYPYPCVCMHVDVCVHTYCACMYTHRHGTFQMKKRHETTVPAYAQSGACHLRTRRQQRFCVYWSWFVCACMFYMSCNQDISFPTVTLEAG